MVHTVIGWMLVVLISACTSDPGDPAGTGGTSGTAGASGTGGTGGNVPESWSRVGMSCGSEGQSCAECDSQTICYVQAPESCVPRSGGVVLRCSVGRCAADQPYCIHEHCMTAAQAACFCTATPGSTAGGCELTPQAHLDAMANANRCEDVGGACGTGIASCCANATCITWPGEPSECAAQCLDADDCESGCCVPLSNSSTRICAAAEFCACQAVGDECGGDAGSCCGGSLCVGNAGASSRCAQQCNNNEQCETGCCRPLSTGTANICDEAWRCQCAAVDEPCGAGVGNCCEGNRCVRYGDAAASCVARCTEPTDCTSGCCAPLTDGSDNVCSPPGNCL